MNALLNWDVTSQRVDTRMNNSILLRVCPCLRCAHYTHTVCMCVFRQCHSISFLSPEALNDWASDNSFRFWLNCTRAVYVSIQQCTCCCCQPALASFFGSANIYTALIVYSFTTDFLSVHVSDLSVPLSTILSIDTKSNAHVQFYFFISQQSFVHWPSKPNETFFWNENEICSGYTLFRLCSYKHELNAHTHSHRHQYNTQWFIGVVLSNSMNSFYWLSRHIWFPLSRFYKIYAMTKFFIRSECFQKDFLIRSIDRKLNVLHILCKLH